MRKITFPILILVLTLVLYPAFLSTQSVFAAQSFQEIFYSQDFNSGTAPEWQLENGWEIAPSEDGNALKGSGHVWARMTAGAWSDYFLRFRVKIDGGASLHANVMVVGPVRYFIGVNPQGLYISKQTGPDTFFQGLANSPGLTPGWHSIEIGITGGKVNVSIDQKSVMKYTDPNPLESGGIAFESLSGGTVWVDDVIVGEILPPGATSQPTIISPTLAPGLKWVRTGGPLGGLGYDIRMRPDNPDIMFVTDAKAGVFKSVDGGQTWTPDNKGITTRAGETGEVIPIFSLTIDPIHPDIVWAGTQSQTGIYKSVDAGETWVKMDNGVLEKAVSMRGFSVDPTSSDIVYATGEVSSWEWNGAPLSGKEFDLTKGVVYKTINGGQSWQKIWSGDNLARYIWIDPRNSDVLYVSTGIFDREAANSDYKKGLPGGVGVIKSTDGGKTWKQVNQGLDNLYVGSLFMHPNNPEILIAATGNVTYPERSGVYLTTDGAATWKQTLDAYVINSVEFSISDPNIAYAGDFESFFRSQDGGITWQKQNPEGESWGPPGIQAGQPIDFQVDPRAPNRIFANEYGGGNFLSQDGGLTWIDASHGYTGSMMRQIVVSPDHPAQVYTAGRTGLFTTRNGGEIWNGLAFPPFKINDWHAIAMQPGNPNLLLAELTCRRIIVLSQDGGMHWTKVSEITGDDRVAFRTIVFSPTDPQTVYAGTTGFFSCGQFDPIMPGKGIQVSTDGGQSWSSVNDANTQDAAVSQVAVDPRDPKTVYAATFNRGLLKTTNGGKTWQPLAAQFTKDNQLFSVAISPAEPQVILFGRNRGGLLRSEDGGITWKMVSSGLPAEATVTSIVFDPVNPQVLFLADLFSGVYRSINGGKTWKVINQGLEQRAINSLAFSADGLHLYAASEGMGVHRLDLNGQPPEPLPEPTAAPTLTATVQVEQPTQSPASPETVPLASPTPTGDSGKRFPDALGCRAPAPLVMLVFGCLGWDVLRKNRAKRG